MDNNYLPTTEIELENWMTENCFNFNNYLINGNGIGDGFGIDKSNGRYIWYYIERGNKDNLKYFKSETEIVEYAFNQIKSDEWAKTHCIGFSTDFNKINELKKELEKMNIEFIEDQIPYYGIDKPVYRIFVLGCDIQRTKQFKAEYWTEK